MGARELLADLAGAGLTVTADRERLVIRPASKLTEALRSALRDAKPELLNLLAESRDQGTPNLSPSFLARRDRLLRWGWPEADAEAVAGRLTNRDHDDERVSCTDCRHYRPGHCGEHKEAGLDSHEVGRDLAALPQSCPAFDSTS